MFYYNTEEVCWEKICEWPLLFWQEHLLEGLRAWGGSSLVNLKKNITNDFKWFFLALDKSAGVIKTTQLLFIWEVNTKFEVTEELLSMNSLCGSTTNKNIFNRVEKTLIQYKLRWNLFRSITADGIKNMCWLERYLVNKFTELVKMLDI